MKADKSNTTVILDKNEYKTNVETYILQNNYKKLNYDLINKYQARMKNTLKEKNIHNILR